MPSAAHFTKLVALLFALHPSIRGPLGWDHPDDVNKFLQNAALTRKIQFVEVFSGSQGLTQAARSEGLSTKGFDVVRNPEENILTNQGFTTILKHILSIQEFGVAWFGVPCNSFIWMARSFTKRSRENPLGDTTKKVVQKANAISERVAMLLLVCVLWDVYYLIEQPVSTLLWRQPCLLSFFCEGHKIGKWKWQKRFLWLGHFGHQCQKPTMIVGIFPRLASTWVLNSVKKKGKTSKLWKQYRNKRGKKCVDGKKGLKETGIYPRKFCSVMARLIANVLAESPQRLRRVAQ